jgi:outer membrane receptor for ferrienterochelin and colicin
MKNIKFQSIILITVLLTLGCTSTQTSSTNIKKKNAGRDYSMYTNLGDILRQTPGVQVSGTGTSIIVQVRGMSSLMLDTRPLYVVDRVIIGNDYNQANASLSTANIASVRVIKDLTELTKYGEQGRNGVIYIKSKN